MLVAGVLVVTGLINWAAAGRAMSDFARAEVARSTQGLARGTADRIAQIVRMGEIELVTHVSAHSGLSGADPARARAAFAPILRFHLQTLFVSLLTLALAVLVSLALSRRLTRPLEVLVSALRDVSRGRTEVRLPERSAAEWGELARAFNRMVTELDEYQRRLNERASRDPLTGVLNRGSLDEELDRSLAVARRTGAPLAVLMLDLDDFKAYNDAFGHPAGDEVLRALAEVAASNVREGDRVARYGGEEFTVVLPDSDCATAAAVAERIRAAMAERTFLRPVTVSIGVACHPDHGDTPAALIAQADAALYAAKQAGKNRVAVRGDACKETAQKVCDNRTAPG